MVVSFYNKDILKYDIISIPVVLTTFSLRVILNKNDVMKISGGM